MPPVAVRQAVMHFLVVHAQKGLQQHLIVELYKEELFQDMMSETDDISRRRAECIEQLSAARRSLGALDELPRALSSYAHNLSNLPPLRSCQPGRIVTHPPVMLLKVCPRVVLCPLNQGLQGRAKPIVTLDVEKP